MAKLILALFTVGVSNSGYNDGCAAADVCLPGPWRLVPPSKPTRAEVPPVPSFGTSAEVRPDHTFGTNPVILAFVLAVAVGIIAVQYFVNGAPQAVVNSPAQTSAPAGGAVSGNSSMEILIQYKKPLSEAEKQAVRKRACVVLLRQRNESFINIDVVAPEQTNPMAVQEAIDKLRQEPTVEFAERQNIYTPEANHK